MNRREFNLSLAGWAAGLGAAAWVHAEPVRPNVLWLIAEDMCPDLGCYGNRLVRTPNIDRLASEGTRFAHAFSTAPVCSPSRSALSTGMYQTSIGAHHHRSHRSDGHTLPKGVRFLSHIFQESGYFTSNATYTGAGKLVPGKTDYNFTMDHAFDGVDWRERASGQPFFAQVNFHEAHRGPAWTEARKRARRIDPARVTLPPYYPDDPVAREDVATYLDAINGLDEKVGEVLQRLKDDGLADNTIIAFFGDNGQCLVRGKQWLYDAGIHVPLIMHWPGHIEAGRVQPGLASLIDVTASSLALAGLPRPERMDGRMLFGPEACRRDCIVAARDRCDETRDHIRCVRTLRFKYIRNFMPERPYTQPNNYIETNYPVLGLLKQCAARGTLNAAQQAFMQAQKPAEELYDLEKDPCEVNNLAGEPAYQSEISGLRAALDRWVADSGDQGDLPEAPSAIPDDDKPK